MVRLCLQNLLHLPLRPASDSSELLALFIVGRKPVQHAALINYGTFATSSPLGHEPRRLSVWLELRQNRLALRFGQHVFLEQLVVPALIPRGVYRAHRFLLLEALFLDALSGVVHGSDGRQLEIALFCGLGGVILSDHVFLDG